MSARVLAILLALSLATPAFAGVDFKNADFTMLFVVVGLVALLLFSLAVWVVVTYPRTRRAALVLFLIPWVMLAWSAIRSHNHDANRRAFHKRDRAAVKARGRIYQDLRTGRVSGRQMAVYTDELLADGSASYSVDVYGPGDTPPVLSESLPANTLYILITASTPGSEDLLVGARVDLSLRMGIFAADGMELLDLKTDIWNSREGPYSDSSVFGSGKGHIGTNSTKAGAVTFGPTAVLDPNRDTAGASVYAPEGAPPGLVKGNSPRNYLALERLLVPRPMPAVKMGCEPGLGDDVTGPGGPQFHKSGYLIPGVYRDVKVNGWELNLKPAGNYIFNSLTVGGNGSVLSLGELRLGDDHDHTRTTVKAWSDIVLESGAVVNPTHVPDQLHLESAEGGIRFSKVRSVYCVAYAPAGTIELEKATVYGSLVGRRVRAWAGSLLHYDTALADVDSGMWELDISKAEYFDSDGAPFVMF